jgi:hypothetical protein
VTTAKTMTRAESKRMWAKLAKVVHPVKLSERECKRLYDFAQSQRGQEGWTK